MLGDLVPDDSDETDDEGQDKKQKAVLKVSLTNSNVHPYTRDVICQHMGIANLFMHCRKCQYPKSCLVLSITLKQCHFLDLGQDRFIKCLPLVKTKHIAL